MPFNFDIDAHLNPYIPRPRLYRLPRPISRFLGYRTPGTEIRTKDATIWFWGFIGAFVGIACVEGIFLNIGGPLKELGVPMVIGSFGATAILLFNSVDSPLSQPRNVVLGQLIAALIGISITKLFLLSSRFDELVWLVGAISCATALVVMAVTKTTHPPAGATALIAAVDSTCRGLGWWYLTAVLLSVVVMLVVALLIDNIKRRYPLYWWTPVPLGPLKEKEDVESGTGGEKPGIGADLRKEESTSASDFGAERRSSGSDLTLGEDQLEDLASIENKVVITAGNLSIPGWLKAELEEVGLGVLEMIQSRLAEVERGEACDELKRLRSRSTVKSGR